MQFLNIESSWPWSHTNGIALCFSKISMPFWLLIDFCFAKRPFLQLFLSAVFGYSNKVHEPNIEWFCLGYSNYLKLSELQSEPITNACRGTFHTRTRPQRAPATRSPTSWPTRKTSLGPRPAWSSRLLTGKALCPDASIISVWWLLFCDATNIRILLAWAAWQLKRHERVVGTRWNSMGWWSEEKEDAPRCPESIGNRKTAHLIWNLILNKMENFKIFQLGDTFSGTSPWLTLITLLPKSRWH